MPEIDVWSIFFLPLGSFVLIALLRPVMGSRWRGAGYLTVAAMAAAFVLSLWALIEVINAPGHDLGFETREWLTVGSLTINVGITMDGLTAVMAVIVTGVSLLVQVYGLQYMKDDESFTRYFAYMSLFTASMLGLVMASGLVFLFVFWELVGLSSYLLIGFWFRKPEAARAAKKAFLVTRLGDVGFMIAIAWAFVFAGTLDIEALNHAAEVGAIAGVGLTWLCLGIFAGAVGKSGQFPLHVWLPDAMEGPTPVSALIHAATMVAAGVFLVARMFPLFEHSESALTVVAWIGGGTAMLAATMALVNNDIKRVLAFSTVSQLGYMFLALGTGAFGAAIFHLLAHAFFKALLFLGAGSVHHTTETYDMRYMGGLGRFMPRTYGTMMIGALALVGIFPLAGFWSKDAILLAASENTFGIGGGAALYWIAVLTAGITGFYVFRMLFMTFSGEYKGGAEAEAAAHAPAGNGEPDAAVAASDHGSEHGHGAPHESPWLITLPLVALAVPAVFFGLADLPWDFLDIGAFSLSIFLGEAHPHEFNVGVAAVSSAVGAAGVVLAYSMYRLGAPSPAAVTRRFAPVYRVLANRYYIDTLYEEIIVRRLFIDGAGAVVEFIDTHLVDRAVNFTGWLGRNLGRWPSTLQNGQVQAYGAVIASGVILIAAAFWIWG